MMRDPLVLLNYEAKRRPEIARLIQEIDQLTPPEISTLTLPLPWMRDALLKLKGKRQMSAWAASVDDWVRDGLVDDPIGTVRRWIDGEAYVRVGRTELLMSQGQLIWIDEKGIWFDTIHTTFVDPKLHTHTEVHGKMSRSEYYASLRGKVRGGEPTLVEDEKPRFQIYRLG